MSEKTEKPTPKRLRDARKKGQVAKSKEIATCAIIVGLFAYMWVFFAYYFEHLKHFALLPADLHRISFDQAFIALTEAGFKEFALLTVPFALTALVIAVLSYLLQIGVLFAFEPIKPDIKKINPIEGFKRIFSLSNLLELVKSIIKILLLTCIIYLLIKSNIQNLFNILQGTSQTALDVLASILKKLVIWVSSVFIVIAILDHFFQKYLHIKKLKMSKDDVKREYKDQEGDPHLRQRRKQLQIEMLMNDIVGKIKQSTVIITKSKKLAVAVYYEFGKTALPIINVKGKELLAAKIIAMAKEYKIPVISDPGLTKKLYENEEEDNYISSKYIEPVAAVLREVMGMGGTG